MQLIQVFMEEITRSKFPTFLSSFALLIVQLGIEAADKNKF